MFLVAARQIDCGEATANRKMGESRGLLSCLFGPQGQPGGTITPMNVMQVGQHRACQAKSLQMRPYTKGRRSEPVF